MNLTRFFYLLVVLAVLVLLYFGSPHGEAWWLKCPLFQMTGLQCPFCGLQRAVHAFLHGDFLMAWRYNPALWLLLPYVLFWGVGCFSVKVVRSQLYARLTSLRAVAFVVLLLLLWGVVRNVW